MWSWCRHQGKAEFMWLVRAAVSQSGQEPQRGPGLGGGGEVPGSACYYLVVVGLTAA